MKRIATRRAACAVLALLAASFVGRRIAFFSLEGRLSRRSLVRIGGLGLVTLVSGPRRGRSLVTRRPSGASFPAAGCVLTPEQTEGPYYIAKEPDSLTDLVYRRAPYKARAAARDTRNSDDSIYRNGGPQSMLSVKRDGDGGYIGAITLGMRRA